MRVTYLLPLILAATGCASSSIYQDPKTGQVAQCNASTPAMFPIIAQSEINNCSAAYERMGWKRQ